MWAACGQAVETGRRLCAQKVSSQGVWEASSQVSKLRARVVARCGRTATSRTRARGGARDVLTQGFGARKLRHWRPASL